MKRAASFTDSQTNLQASAAPWPQAGAYPPLPQQNPPNPQEPAWTATPNRAAAADPWLCEAQALQEELAISRAAWKRASPPLLSPLPFELVQRIVTEALLSSDDKDDPRPGLALLHALGRISKGASATKAEILAQLPKDLQVRIGLAEFAMLSGRLSEPLDQLSRFIARRNGLDDPYWDQRELPEYSEPRWGQVQAVLPDVSLQAKWRNLIELHPENLQHLSLSVETVLEEQTIATLAGCSELRTVRLDPNSSFPIHQPHIWSLHDSRLNWLDRLPKLERLEVHMLCNGLGWIPEQTRSKLKVLVLNDFVCTAQSMEDLKRLPLELEVEINTKQALGPPVTDTPFSDRITGFHYRMHPMQLELLQALPATLGKLELLTDDTVLKAALDRFKNLTELDVMQTRDATWSPLCKFVGEACSLRKLIAHVSSKEAKSLIDALKANRSLETIQIGSLTTQASLSALNALIACHPMKNLVVWLGKHQSTSEAIRPMLEAVGASKTLRSFTLRSSHGIGYCLQQTVALFEPEASGLLDFSAQFDMWSIKTRSLKFWESEKPAQQEAGGVKKRRRTRKKS